MSARYAPRTLAATLSYVGYHSPGEHGLYWDPDGTMPWKEFHWALQEDPSLRFVREMHLRELKYLGVELPFSLDGRLLRLNAGVSAPSYPETDSPPKRLYCGCSRKQYPRVSKVGLETAGRSFLPVSSERELAARIGRRRDPEPLVIEISADRASTAGVRFREVGGGLYLVASVPVEFLILPKMREDALLRLSKKRKPGESDKKPGKAGGYDSTAMAGSFFLDLGRRPGEAPPGKEPAADKSGKARRGATWKRESRKDRNKRNV